MQKNSWIRRRHADTWPNLKREMRSRFVHASYVQDLLYQGEGKANTYEGGAEMCTYVLTQGFKSMQQYNKDIEVALLKANVLESSEAIMAYFLHGLNREIQDVVELYNYTSVDDLAY
ncbi:hypothetical protein CR513_20636, partial [Mucuna pruriens]